MGKYYNLTPKEIVGELDKYIIGQDDAKKSIAIALRNRHRRNQLSDEMREEVTPKNILMIGPTGCGKTEIARRLAKIMEAPFVKVEATKFTEVGYVGKDVETIIKDLAEASVRLTKQLHMEKKYEEAEQIVEDKIVEAMIPSKKKQAAPQQQANAGQSDNPFAFLANIPGVAAYFPQQPQQPQQPLYPDPAQEEAESSTKLAREQVRQQLRDGLLEEQFIDIDVLDNSSNNIELGGNENMSISLGSIFGDMMPQKTKKKKVKVKDARKILKDQEAQNLLDMDEVTAEAMENAQQNGIVFIDEIDKIADSSQYGHGPGVSREGVQRDILPIVEGSVVNTKYGPLKTDHILFIGAGAFHVSKPSDLIPELQGRFPIRVSLNNLTQEDLKKILTVPKNAILTQQKQLMETEGSTVEFTDEAIDTIAAIAFKANEKEENIGARRLHTVMEKLMEDISFNLPDPELAQITIDKAYVEERFTEKLDGSDMDKYLL